MSVSGESTYSAELFVASQFTYAGWNTYFPQRDKGFDFVASKNVDGREIIRPVQVKGKYPEKNTNDRDLYGYIGDLTRYHKEMVVAIPFYSSNAFRAPEYVAYVPPAELRDHSRGYRVQPSKLKNGVPEIRPAYSGYVGKKGLAVLEEPDWATKTWQDRGWYNN